MARKINKINSLLVPGVLGIGGLVGMVGSVHANTLGPVSATGTVSSTLTDWSGNLTFPQFNPALGTLTNVSLTFNSAMTTNLKVTNTGNSSSSGLADTKLELSITDASGVLPGGTYLGPAIGYSGEELNYTNSPDYTYTNLAAGGNISSGTLTGNGTYTGSFGNASLLSEFTGGGSVVLPASTFTTTTITNTGGNTNANQVTDAGLTGTVTYTYNPTVPEPATMSLLVLGGTAALLQRRRRPTGKMSETLTATE